MQTDRMMGGVNAFPDPYPQKAVRLAMMFFIALQCMDLITTLAAFSRGGVELNPVVRSLMPWTGQVAAVVVSKSILISLVFLLSRRKRILYFGNILYSAIVTWNMAIVFALR
jgi:hypothetical protein